MTKFAAEMVWPMRVNNLFWFHSATIEPNTSFGTFDSSWFKAIDKFVLVETGNHMQNALLSIPSIGHWAHNINVCITIEWIIIYNYFLRYTKCHRMLNESFRLLQLIQPPTGHIDTHTQTIFGWIRWTKERINKLDNGLFVIVWVKFTVTF